MAYSKIIDVHAHIFPEAIAEKAVKAISMFYYSSPMSGNGTVSDLINSGSKINVYKYVVHSTATKPQQVTAINDFISSVQSQNDCIIGFGTLHPDMSDVNAEVERMASLGLKGIKLHPDFQNFNIDQDNMLPIYKAIEGRFPLIMHMGDENRTTSHPQKLAKILEMFPKMVVIAAHFGGFMRWNESIEYLVGKNVYFDTSSTFWKLDKKTIVEMIRKHGVEKILFGSDYPMWGHKDELERFKELGLSEEEEKLILWENASKLLNIETALQ